MRKINVKILLLSSAVLMCSAAPVSAGPILYASSDPDTSSGTELYVIDPIAATITVVRGAGIGSGGTGTYGGVYGGGGYASSSGGDGGTGGTSGLTGGSGGATGGGGSVSTSSTSDPAAPTNVSVTTDSIDITPQKSMIVFADSSKVDLVGGGGGNLHAPGGSDPDTPSGGPSGGCIGDCPPLNLLVDCVSDCGGNGGSSQGGVGIAAVPEPGTLALLGLVFASGGLARIRKMF